jgi:adenylate cyclase class IV
MKNTEIELKFKATVSLSKFKEFCQKRNPRNYVEVAGWDYFYSNPQEPESFFRHRVNPKESQVTFKRKTHKDNNYIREEKNFDTQFSREQVADLCAISGYTYNSTIFKNCFIYNYEDHTLVFYICYDVEMKELGRFIEIEMKEDYPWANEDEAFSKLTILEKLCKPLELSPAARVSQSLFEMYRR